LRDACEECPYLRRIHDHFVCAVINALGVRRIFQQKLIAKKQLIDWI